MGLFSKRPEKEKPVATQQRKQQMDCTNCNGTGSVTKALPGGGVTSATCLACHGTGKVAGW